MVRPDPAASPVAASPVPAGPVLASLVDHIETAGPRCGRVRVVAVDGGAAAGKSSLAAALAAELDGAAVLSTDLMLDGWAGQFGFWSRLRTGVLEPLAAGRPGSYRRYDWHAGSFTATVEVPVPRVLLVEGVSAIAAGAGWLSVAIFLDVPRAVRERRWAARDGGLGQPERNWLAAEDRFFAEHPPPPGTLVLTGSPTAPGTPGRQGPAALSESDAGPPSR